MQLYVAPTASAAVKDSVTFCHMNGNGTLNLLTAAPEVVFQSGHDTHQNGQDIIPPFEYVKKGETISFAGQNYDPKGQATLANGCVVPTIITPVAPQLVQPTCDVSYGVLSFTTSNLYTYQVNGAQITSGMHIDPGTTVKVTAVTSTTGSVFAGYATSVTFDPFVVNAAPTDCTTDVEITVLPQSTATKLCGAGNDIITIAPNTVEYSMTSDSGWTQGANGYARTIVYTAKTGHIFADNQLTYTETFTDNDAACTAPVFTDTNCYALGIISLPAITGAYSWRVTINGTVQVLPSSALTSTNIPSIANGAVTSVELLYGTAIVASWTHTFSGVPEGCVLILQNAAPKLWKVDQDSRPLAGAVVSGVACNRFDGGVDWQCQDLADYGLIDPYVNWDFLIKELPMELPIASSTGMTFDYRSEIRIMMWEVSAPQGYVITPKTYAVEYRCGAWRVLTVASRTFEGLAAAPEASCVSPILNDNTFLWVNVKPGKGEVAGETTPKILATSTTLPSTIPATGPTDSPQFLLYGLLMTIFSYGAVYFAQPRRDI